MKLFSCTKQKEVTAALEEGRWPQAPELQAHAASCRSCGDLVLVTQTLQQARRQTMQTLSLEPGWSSSNLASSGTLWWRAELRRRREAVERVTRPIAFVEKLTLVGVPLTFLGLIAWQGNKITDWLAWLAGRAALLPDDIGAIMPDTSGVISLVLAASLGGLILISGLALSLLREEE